MVKAPNFHCQERTKYTPEKRGFDPVPQRSPQAGRMVLKSRPVVTMAGAKADIQFSFLFEICNIIMEEPFFSALPLLLAVLIISSALISIFTMGRYFSREKMRWEIQIWVKLKTCQIYEWFSRNWLSSGRFDRGSRTWIGFLNIGQIFLVFKEVSTQLNSDRIRSSLELFKFPFKSSNPPEALI